MEAAFRDWSVSNEKNVHSKEEEGKELWGKMERLILAGKGELSLGLLRVEKSLQGGKNLH